MCSPISLTAKILLLVFVTVKIQSLLAAPQYLVEETPIVWCDEEDPEPEPPNFATDFRKVIDSAAGVADSFESVLNITNKLLGTASHILSPRDAKDADTDDYTDEPYYSIDYDIKNPESIDNFFNDLVVF